MRRVVASRWAATVITPLAASSCARHVSLNPVNWFRKRQEEDDEGGFSNKISRSTNPNLEDELPEVFANQPQEVDDYIRPDKSFFESLEDWWDYIATFFQPVEKQIAIMRSWHADGPFGTGLDLGGWGQTFLVYGFAVRCVTLIPALYAHRNSLRVARINPQLSQFTDVINKTKKDKTLTSPERRVIQDGYKRMKKQLCAQHNCAQWKSSVAIMATPITLSAFLGIRKMVVYETDLEKSSFLWLEDLTAPDPTYALPILCASLFYANFELNQAMTKGTRNSSVMYIRWACRAGLCGFVYFAADSQPAAMFAYWFGMSLAGLLQPLLLRMQWFRDMFGFPDPPDAAKANIIGSNIKGPSMYERIFATPEEKARLAEERKKQMENERTSKAFQRIEEFDVIIENDIPSAKPQTNARSKTKP